MSEYRLVVQTKSENGNFVNDEIIFTGKVKRPESIIDMGLRHTQQIDILEKIQDNLLLKQSIYLKEDINNCPKCGHQLNKNGLRKSSFNAVFTDHKVPVQRQICPDCKWRSIPSVNSLFGTNLHPGVVKMWIYHAFKINLLLFFLFTFKCKSFMVRFYYKNNFFDLGRIGCRRNIKAQNINY